MGVTDRPDKALRGVGDTAPCIGCGMCCDGTIYERAKTYPAERDQLKRAGLSLVRADNKPYFALPCRFCQNGRCGIYAERFTTCRTFRCDLLRAYQAGELTREESLHKVSEALALRREIMKQEPGAALSNVRRELRVELQASRERPELLLKITALDRLLDSWFKKNRQSQAASEQPRESGPDRRSRRRGRKVASPRPAQHRLSTTVPTPTA